MEILPAMFGVGLLVFSLFFAHRFLRHMRDRNADHQRLTDEKRRREQLQLDSR